ncbi:ComF family protein [Aestuariimicrobium ganziense]|uniref:ComF family protein n=1 Tax=Aestuariimicrobium ganziense TaxID=2773677 RepID=UPI0019448A20|nr:phosphoribosyltransferase family protein [Aestuariimicrobium ganziense]
MRFVDALADLFLGAECTGCGEPVLGLCPACRASLGLGPLERDLSGLRVVSATSYQPPVTAIVKGFKDAQAWGLAAPLAEAMSHVLPAVADAVLVAVPSPGASVRSRGFDHTRALALHLGRLSSMPVRRLLRRPGVRVDQTELHRADRWANQLGRFSARGSGQQVVLVDDVVTTGATLVAAAGALEAVGHRVALAVTVASSQLWTTTPDMPDRKADRVADGG